MRSATSRSRLGRVSDKQVDVMAAVKDWVLARSARELFTTSITLA